MLGEIRFRSAGILAFTEDDEPEDEDEPEEPLSSFEAFSEM